MSMNTASLHVKLEPEMKREAKKVAEDLGLSLSAVTKSLLKQFIRTKRLAVGERPEIPNARTRRELAQAEEDIKAGRGHSYKNHEEFLAYLHTLIDNDRQKSK